MDRKEVIDLLSKKLNGDLKISYDHLAVLTNYSKRQLIRLSKSLNEKGKENIEVLKKQVNKLNTKNTLNTILIPVALGVGGFVGYQIAK